MKRFKILDVKHLRTDSNERVAVYSPLLNKDIILPHPEFREECILVIANPIDLSLSEERAVVGELSMKENARTCYFIKPYLENDYQYWKSLSQEEDDWIPFFPEQKEILYTEDGNIISFYKDISFNKNWQPISHALYVRRIDEEHFGELDYMDVNVDCYVEIDVEKYEYNNANDNYDVYATECFGEIEEDECQDEVWECAKLLQKEMLFIIQITTQIENNRKDYVREVLAWDVKDALDQIFQEEGKIDFSDVTSYRVYYNNELIMHAGSWIKIKN